MFYEIRDDNNNNNSWYLQQALDSTYTGTIFEIKWVCLMLVYQLYKTMMLTHLHNFKHIISFQVNTVYKPFS